MKAVARVDVVRTGFAVSPPAGGVGGKCRKGKRNEWKGKGGKKRMGKGGRCNG